MDEERWTGLPKYFIPLSFYLWRIRLPVISISTSFKRFVVVFSGSCIISLKILCGWKESANFGDVWLWNESTHMCPKCSWYKTYIDSMMFCWFWLEVPISVFHILVRFMKCFAIFTLSKQDAWEKVYFSTER